MQINMEEKLQCAWFAKCWKVNILHLLKYPIFLNLKRGWYF